MVRKNKKDYTLLNFSYELASIDDYRAAPWIQKYGRNTIDFRRWLYIGRPKFAADGSSCPDNNGENIRLVHAGRDNVVEAICRAVWHIPSVEEITKSTYCHEGLTCWFEYLDYRYAAARPVFLLADIDREVIQGFIQWMKITKEAYTDSGRISSVTARGHYSKVKTVLQYLVRLGSLPEGLFPINPFPNNARATKGHKPYSKIVMTSLMTAIYRDIKAIREGFIKLPGSDVLGLYLLVIAARTGRNTTPLLELTRNAVLQHPIKPDKLGLLVTYKRRGRKTSIQAFEKPQNAEDIISLPMDALTVYRDAVNITEPLITEASPKNKNRVWLYRKSYSTSGKILALSPDTLFTVLQRLVRRHGLTEDSKLLIVNISRLRKTFAQRIWQISGGDLIATAEHLGNTPAVASQSYIAIMPEMVTNFRCMGLLMHADWAGKLDDFEFLENLAADTGIPVESLRDVAVGYNNTGVGRCTDPKYGVRAPGDGTHCTRWIECFRCPNLLVMESDLYRLFSFYYLLINERNHISKEKWDKLYGPIVKIIDEEIVLSNLRTNKNPKGCFESYQVNKARTKAKEIPHRMWLDRAILGNVS